MKKAVLIKKYGKLKSRIMMFRARTTLRLLKEPEEILRWNDACKVVYRIYKNIWQKKLYNFACKYGFTLEYYLRKKYNIAEDLHFHNATYIRDRYIVINFASSDVMLNRVIKGNA